MPSLLPMTYPSIPGGIVASSRSIFLNQHAALPCHLMQMPVWTLLEMMKRYTNSTINLPTRIVIILNTFHPGHLCHHTRILAYRLTSLMLRRCVSLIWTLTALAISPVSTHLYISTAGEKGTGNSGMSALRPLAVGLIVWICLTFSILSSPKDSVLTVPYFWRTLRELFEGRERLRKISYQSVFPEKETTTSWNLCGNVSKKR
jgi:hypothetical protein